MKKDGSTICSISTPQGVGAIAIVRVSGNDAFVIAEQLFKSEFPFRQLEPNLSKFAEIYEGDDLIDQVMVVKFAAPHSYTGEDMVEISCHGSFFIQKKILELFVKFGAHFAAPGEFTMRAFLNGKMDLPQAEAVADLIDSQTEAAHKLAINQLRGNFSSKIAELREQFVELASLLELELDFSEEDVQFADREQLKIIISKLKEEVNNLIKSFKLGNVIKTGIPVAIVGKPNVGKSTLLNALLNDERAIVSQIPGTTRDTIEDTFNIQGITFRFIDTAGIRLSEDEIENFGIERTFKAIEKADIILYMIDINRTSIADVEEELLFFENEIDFLNKKLIIIANKIDELNEMPNHFSEWNDMDIIYISAKRKVNLNYISDMLIDSVNSRGLHNGTLLTNARHYDSMVRIAESLDNIEKGLTEELPTDLIAVEIRSALTALGVITGQVSSQELLNNIFGKFCIGK